MTDALAEAPPRAKAAPATDTAVDPQHPWLGLASFTEETRSYFHGREDEVAELARRVERKLLTILFGQSGLGKTSILRAGIVPRLRPEGYCPVYVRVDYAAESPSPAEQIKQAIFRATESTGSWTRSGVAEQGESLWEFLHHRDDILKDANGRTVVPLLIFDQFEEIFTLGQADATGRARASQFVEDLADLVENRPPKALEARLDSDDTLTERFDFARADYRILIALREDYLAHLEGLKVAMPSITQNRMRLAPMTGAQALSAVMKPGGKLVTQEVAEAIVRFIAGGSELRNAEVEPSLLSLICRELNNARIAQGRSEISADLLAGSHETILSEFYERALADQPAAVRKVIEDQLLTESGFRENVAEERLAKALSEAGAAPGTIATLVNRRLLRIEERLDVRRVELTHDVLCGVVRASRELRLEREALEKAQQALVAQREREAATRRALVRARRIAAGSAALAVVAVAGAIFGYVNMQRAQDAEARAQAVRAQAESARGEAEKLVVYLLDDFLQELEPVGRLDIVASLSKRAIDYYQALPAELRNPESERNRALALARYGHALRYQNKLDEAARALDESIAVLEKVRAGGDTSESATVGLALALSSRGRVFDSQANQRKAYELAKRSAEVVEPLVSQPKPSTAVLRSFGGIAIYRGFVALRQNEEEDAVRWLDRSRDAWRSLGALEMKDLSAAAGYAEATAWKTDALNEMGRYAEARASGEEGRRIGASVLEKRPGHMGALRAQGLTSSSLSQLSIRELRPKAAVGLAEDAMRSWEALLRLDPSNAIAWGNLSASNGAQIWALWELGKSREALEALRSGLAKVRPALDAGLVAYNVSFNTGWGAAWAMEAGEAEQSAAFFKVHYPLVEAAVKRGGKDAFFPKFWPEWTARFEALTALSRNDPKGAIAISEASIARLRKIPIAAEAQRRAVHGLIAFAWQASAIASYLQRDYRSAEASAREAIKERLGMPQQNLDDQLALADDRTIHAMALARLQRLQEAREAIEPALELHRKLAARGGEDLVVQMERAAALHASALANPAQAAALNGEADRILASFPPDMARRHMVGQVRRWIAEERAKGS